MLDGRGPARSDTDISIQGDGPYYALGMTAPADSPSQDIIYIPDLPSTRFYAGALALLSVLQYFVAEAAVIGAWAGQQPYSRRTGYISDLGAAGCGVFDGRDVCSPAHVLMNASFVVQGIGMMVGALLLSTALLCTAARPGARFTLVSGQPDGVGCRDLRAGPHRRRRCRDRPGGAGPRGRRLRVARGGRHHVLRRRRPGAGAAGLALAPADTAELAHPGLRRWCPSAALITGGVTGMDVPEPGTLERLMGYPITIGTAAVGLVVAQRVGEQRAAVRRARLALAH